MARQGIPGGSTSTVNGCYAVVTLGESNVSLDNVEGFLGRPACSSTT
jgi:hypothetical protein